MSDRNTRAARTCRRAITFGRFVCSASLSIFMLLALAAAAHAQQDRNWDANGTAVGNGGTGIWDITAVTWSPNADGVSGPYGAWDNLALDNAIFGGTAGTVTLGVPNTAHNLTFQTNVYTLTGSTLTLGGVTPTITTNPNVTSTINSILAGSAGLTKAGTGTLNLGGANTFTGDININAGFLGVTSDAALGDAANVVNLAGGARLTATGLLSSSRVVNLAGGEGQLAGTGVGSVRITGAGGVAVLNGVALNNDANDYTGQTRFFVDGTASFTSIGNLGEASSLGAPTTVAAGTVFFQGVASFADTVRYVGDGDISNRNFVFEAIGGSSTTQLQNGGTGTLTLTGDMTTIGAEPACFHCHYRRHRTASSQQLFNLPWDSSSCLAT